MRIPILCPKVIYHVYNRGVSKSLLFKDELDYRLFQYKLIKFKKKYDIEIITYCLMPNHFHLLLKTENKKSNISKFMKSLQQSYAISFNSKYDHSGHVFESAYCNKAIKDAKHLAQVIKYIAENPVKKKLVKSPDQWPYSSF